MIYLVTSRPESYDWSDLKQEEIVIGEFDEFVHWAAHQTIISFDTETTMIETNPDQHEDRKLLVMQFGSIDKANQWIFDMTGLELKWITAVKRLLSNELVQFIIHYATFDYTVVKAQLGVSIENIHDTCLMSKILNTGIEVAPGYHSLLGCLYRFFNLEISKDAQKGFTVNPLTKEQVLYAAIDVIMLYDLFLKLKELLVNWQLWYLYDVVERHAIKVYADMELSPMRFDKAHWATISTDFITERDQLEKDLTAEVWKDPKLVAHLMQSTMFIKDTLIQPMDEVMVNWGSTTHKNLILKKFIPSIPDTIKTKPDLKAWFKATSATLTTEEISIINLYMSRSYDVLTALILKKDKPWLQSVGLFIPKDTVLINWASNVHKLYIFQFYYPKLDDTNAKSLANITKNPLISVFKKYSAANKNVTTYGDGFCEKYVNRHGMIAPSGLNQILATGRIAFGILLQMPAKAKFRNAFLPPEDDWLFVDSDYSSAEVCIMAHAAGESAFLDAVKTGKDLHMMSASLIFADEWQALAEPGCTHIIDGSKCDCKGHNTKRKFSKAITFGLAYGLSSIGLADRLDISRSESQALMQKFFATFPKLEGYFSLSENFGIQNLYIRGLMPTGRIRFYEHPQNEGDKSSIGRASKNFPIQECNATMLKIAMVNLRSLIIKNNYPARLHLPVHDEILASAHKDFAQQWKSIQDREMRKAADLFLQPGLLGTDTEILSKWTK
jgi:DNA polymerase I-like protein with 3'-5' exonuclease and polymerase domains